MRERIGIILGISGILLLNEPSINLQQLYGYLSYIAEHYWPVGLILAGMILINPGKRKTRSRNR